MEWGDAIGSTPDARSVVEYRLTPCFRRSYSPLFKAIHEMEWDELVIARLIAPYLRRPRQRSYGLLATDVTSQPRPLAPTLVDRGMVYQPNAVNQFSPGLPRGMVAVLLADGHCNFPIFYGVQNFRPISAESAHAQMNDFHSTFSSMVPEGIS